MVDACIDAFKDHVQKRLAEARSSDLLGIYEKIAKFRANITFSLTIPVIVPEDSPLELLFDLFSSEDHIQSSLGKRPLIEDGDIEERRVRQKTSNVDEEEVDDELW